MRVHDSTHNKYTPRIINNLVNPAFCVLVVHNPPQTPSRPGADWKCDDWTRA